jgi:hypothetical protein
MSDAELDELGQDIKANGLRQPIVIWTSKSGVYSSKCLLDGRNRLEASQRAGIDTAGMIRGAYHLPIGTDPYAYVIGSHRRHLTIAARRA